MTSLDLRRRIKRLEALGNGTAFEISPEDLAKVDARLAEQIDALEPGQLERAAEYVRSASRQPTEDFIEGLIALLRPETLR